MKRVLPGLIAGALLLVSGPRLRDALGQQTLSVNVDLVNIVFSVTDRNGRFVSDLPRESFRVYEDGRQQTVTNFSAESNLPLALALVVDTSSSVRERLDFQKEAAIEFFHSTLIRNKDRAVVLAFHSGVELVQDFTDDAGVLADAIRTMRPGGSTALYDAVYLAAVKKLAAQNGRRVIIVFSDGDDNSSRSTLAEALEAVQRHDAVVFAISTTSNGKESKEGKENLETITRETGGKVFFPRRLQDLPETFSEVTRELRSQYTLAYRPTNTARDGRFRKIRIEVEGRGYVVRSRSGYYAPGD